MRGISAVQQMEASVEQWPNLNEDLVKQSILIARQIGNRPGRALAQAWKESSGKLKAVQPRIGK